MSEEQERESSVTVDFTNNRLPDGTYRHNRLDPSGTCATCHRLITEHSREELHECGIKKARELGKIL